MNQFVS